MNILNKIESLGFTTYEAKAYYALLRKYPANGYEISKLAEIPPSKIYETLSKLKNHGAILDSQSDPVLYYPVEPEILFNRIKEETEKNIQSVLNDLSFVPPPEAFDLTWNLKGTDVINQKIADLITQAKEEVFASLWPEQISILQPVINLALQRGVSVIVATFGSCNLQASEVFSLQGCIQQTVNRTGARLCTVIKDDTEVVIGHLLDESRLSTGVWTRTPSLVLVAKEYVRHDMMMNVLIQSMDEQQYKKIYEENDLLKKLRRKTHNKEEA